MSAAAGAVASPCCSDSRGDGGARVGRAVDSGRQLSAVGDGVVDSVMDAPERGPVAVVEVAEGALGIQGAVPQLPRRLVLRRGHQPQPRRDGHPPGPCRQPHHRHPGPATTRPTCSASPARSPLSPTCPRRPLGELHAALAHDDPPPSSPGAGCRRRAWQRRTHGSAAPALRVQEPQGAVRFAPCRSPWAVVQQVIVGAGMPTNSSRLQYSPAGRAAPHPDHPCGCEYDDTPTACSICQSAAEPAGVQQRVDRLIISPHGAVLFGVGTIDAQAPLPAIR